MNVGQRIKYLRTKLGLSADDIADALGKDRSTVYRYESNEIEKLPTTVLEPLAKILKTTPGYLMGWTKNPDAVEANSDIRTRPQGSSDIEEEVVVYCRNGKTTRKKLTKEQMEYLDKFINSFSEEDYPDL